MAEAWTTSYRWQGRTKAEWGYSIAHNERSPEQTHSNPDIDPARLPYNVTLVPSADGEGWEPAYGRAGRKAIKKAIKDRLKQAKPATRTVTDKATGEQTVREVARRKDAVEVVEFLVQLDPEYTGTCEELLNDPEKLETVQKQLQVMADRVVELMGRENTHAISWHWDETNPHVQILTTPITQEGDLSFRKILPGLKWSAEHDVMRERLREAGYEATMERVDGGRGHDSLTNFKRRRDTERSVEAKQRVAAKDMETATAARSEALAERAEARVDAQTIRDDAHAEAEEIRATARTEGYAEGYEEGKKAAVEALAAREETLAAEAQRLARVAVEVDERAADLEAFSKGLDKPRGPKGVTFRDVLEREAAEARRARERARQMMSEDDGHQLGPDGGQLGG